MSSHPIKNYTVIAGLGGRAILKTSLHRMLDSVVIDDLPKVTFLDLDEDLVQREIDRNRADRRSGPAAENMLRDLGAVRATSA